jgi:3'-phosphoadenosine 5'-phosphosulfate sulfotransferase (PAPS reductase)/FAD synthetase
VNELVTFGGGVNSTAMLIGMAHKGIRPGWILFADTGGEKPETYAHIAKMAEWIENVGGYGFPALITVAKNSMYQTLEDECLRKETLPSIVFGWRSCSDKWKQEPQRKLMNNSPLAREIWARGEKIRKAIGFGVDEQRRAKEFEDEKYVNWYPLIEWGWDRAKCVEVIKAEGFAVPPKSACFYCPASRKPEVLALQKEHPDLYARAVAMEQNAAKNMNVVKGLGRHWSWEKLPEVAIETVEQTCMCFDGE